MNETVNYLTEKLALICCGGMLGTPSVIRLLLLGQSTFLVAVT